MTIKVRQGSLGEQEKSIISACQSISDTIPNLQKAVSSLDNQGNLKGQAVNSAKQFSNAVVTPLLVTVLQFVEYFHDNITKFLSEYDLEKDYTDTELEEKIDQIKQAISSLEMSLVSLNSMKVGLKSNAIKIVNKSISHKKNLIQAKQQQLKEYEDKLEKLRDYNDKSSSFLSELSSLMTNIQTGMKQVSNGYNMGTGTFVIPAQSKLDWAKGAKKYIQSKGPSVNEVLSQLSDQDKKELVKQIEGKSKSEQVNILAKFLTDRNIWKNYDEINSTKAGEFGMSVVSGWVEESLPEISTALACTSTKLPVASMESGAFYALSKGTSIVSKGAPFIGTVLDYGQMVRSGESEKDASNKAIAHAGIDMVTGIAVAAVLPEATAVGTVILATTVVSMIGTFLFDSIYERMKNIEF